MTTLVALALAVGAPPQTVGAPAAIPIAPAAAVTTFDGNWTVVYAENVGKPVRAAPTLAIQNGTTTINIGQPVTYHFDFGPGHAVSAKPAETAAPAVPVAPAPPPAPIAAPAPAAAPPLIPPTPPDLAPTGPTRSGLAPQTTGSAPAATPRLSPDPATLQGVFILSQEYLVLSMSPVGSGALGASPGTLSGAPTGNVAVPGAPGTAAIPTGPQPAANAAGGGVRQDAFVLILRRAPVTAPAR
jgi:hypothetical protein